MNWGLIEISASRAPAGAFLGAILHHIHGEKLMENYRSEFIVTTADGYWGKGATLLEACKNANLEEDSPAERSCETIEHWMHCEQKPIDWADVARQAKPADPEDFEPVEIFVYWWDQDLWENYQICHLTGGVSFTGYMGEPDEAQAAFDKHSFAATWHAGKITARQTNAKAA